jgi:CDP-diacylglycerol---serine O-phosphatidyltransferase
MINEEKSLLPEQNIKWRKKRFMRFKQRFDLRRGLHLLPHLFTLGNAFFGFASIVFASQQDFITAAYFILLGALMDTLDGRVARFMGVTSLFGMQLDSLCDTITFCLAPAFLAYQWELNKIGLTGFIASSIFLLAGLLRLARFNITQEKQTIFFMGVPVTMAGCFIATMFLNTKNNFMLQPLFLPTLFFVVIALALLMVSTIRFPTFKHINKNWYALTFFISTAFVITMGFIKVLFLLFIIYFLFSFEEFLRLKLISLKNKKNLP